MEVDYLTLVLQTLTIPFKIHKISNEKMALLDNAQSALEEIAKGAPLTEYKPIIKKLKSDFIAGRLFGGRKMIIEYYQLRREFMKSEERRRKYIHF